jgi:hypothetical protein
MTMSGHNSYASESARLMALVTVMTCWWSFFKYTCIGLAHWLTTGIPATWELEIGELRLEGCPGKKILSKN